MTRTIRRLSDGGRVAFRTWLEKGGEGAAPLALLEDPETSSPLNQTILRPSAVFGRRYDLGVDLVERLRDIEMARVQTDIGLWDWLSLCLIDQTCPPDETGRRKVAQIDRYLLQLENHWTRSRHLARSAWSLVRVHGSAAQFILSGRLDVHGEAAEQLASRQHVVTCVPLIAALASLVWDGAKGRLKSGFRGSGPGSARRVPVIAKQFGLTYDLASMQPQQILDLLPREFDRFRSTTGRRPQPTLGAELREQSTVHPTMP